jgi:hypothetical protein
MIYYNTSNIGIGTINPNSKLHLYDEVNNTTKLTIQNNFLLPIVSDPVASVSGIITGSSTDQFMIFKDPALTYTFTVPEGGISCDILMIGGGGGSYYKAGGAGACIVAINQIFSQGTYKVYVGDGGGTSYTPTGQGGDSKITTVNDTDMFRAKGGGGESQTTNNVSNGIPGGCGSGAWQGNTGGATVSTNIVNGIESGPVLTNTYVVSGNRGGSKTIQDPTDIIMGGGGIGTFGVDLTSLSTAPKGGNGLYQVIINNLPYNFKSHFANNTQFGVLHTDGNYYIGGGGGGFNENGELFYNGGLGGGGRAGYYNDNGYYIIPEPNTGSGSGGGAIIYEPYNSTPQENARYNAVSRGATGIVIIRYRSLVNTNSSSIELIRGILADTNIDYSIGNYNGDFKIISSSSVAVTDRLVINSTGDFNITGSLSVSGNITAYYSDERLKTKIANINDPLKIIDKLNGFYYIPNELALSLSIKNTKLDIGLSAQEVQKVLPELVNIAPFDIVKDKYGNKVSKSGENYLTLSYDRLAPVFVEAIKELNQKNKSLTNNNIELTNNNIELTNNNIELKEKYNKLAEDIVLIKKTLKLI